MPSFRTSKQHPTRRWATLEHGAEHIGVSVKTMRRMLAAGEIPGYRVGKRQAIRDDLNELDALMQPLRGDAA